VLQLGDYTKSRSISNRKIELFLEFEREKH
jgi:hypothetical protein